MKVVRGKKVTGVIRSLINAKSLQLECTRVLHQDLLGRLLMYGSKTMV